MTGGDFSTAPQSQPLELIYQKGGISPPPPLEFANRFGFAQAEKFAMLGGTVANLQ